MKKLLLIALLFSFVFTCRAQQTAIPKDSVYTITEDNDTSCINQLILQCDTNRYVVAEIYCADGSSIDFCGKYTDRLSHPYVVYTLYNAATDGSSFFIYNLQTHKAYLTNGYFSDLSPVCGAISFACQELLLAPMGTANSTPTDTIDADTREEHITYPTGPVQAMFGPKYTRSALTTFPSNVREQTVQRIYPCKIRKPIRVYSDGKTPLST